MFPNCTPKAIIAIAVARIPLAVGPKILEKKVTETKLIPRVTICVKNVSIILLIKSEFK